MEKILKIDEIIKSDKDNWCKVKALAKKDEQLFGIGRYYSHEMSKDIKHVLFSLSRYKFACKLLMYRKNLQILELGCAEAWGG